MKPFSILPELIPNKPTLKKRRSRFLMLAIIYLSFWYISTMTIGSIDRAATPYWSTGGLLALPQVVLLFLVIDYWVMRKEWARNNLGKYITLVSILGVLLYYPLMLFSLWLLFTVRPVLFG